MITNFQFSVLAAALLFVAIDSYAFWGSAVGKRNSLSAKFFDVIRVNNIASSMVNPSSYSTSSDLFKHIMSDEEEEEEEPEAPPTTTDAPGENSEGMSSVKEGIMFPTTLNGTDVRVGIIMARWNNDIIAGLYKVRVFKTTDVGCLSRMRSRVELRLTIIYVGE